MYAKPAASGITRPAPVANAESPVSHATVSDISAIAAAPAKKFIGIEVAPPVRREAAQTDSRFGVVQAAPEPEKPAPSAIGAPNMDLWGMLNDGRAPVEMHAPQEAVETLQPIEEPEIHEPVPVTPAPVAIAPAQIHAAEAPAPASQSGRNSGRNEKVEAVLLPPKIHEVPVKMQPKHKAFGAKHKVKHKHSKLLKESKPRRDDAQHAAKAHAKKEAQQRAAAHAEKQHAERAPKPSGGLLKRLAKTFLGK